MAERQQILHLWLAAAALDTEVIAWAFHDGSRMATSAASTEADGGDDGRPPGRDRPYRTGVEAMADGWMLLQAPGSIAPAASNGDLGCEFVFERRVDLG